MKKENVLGIQRIGSLLPKFALPAILGNLVGALYNIADQIFIGNYVGFLGNAATSVIFPLQIVCIACALLIGVGGASAFSLFLGQKRLDEAAKTVGNGLVMLFIISFFILILAYLNLESILLFCGATPNVLPYAMKYGMITLIGLPSFMIQLSCSHFIRADGSPKYAMYVLLLGSIVNLILDYVFMALLGYGIQGAAWATIIAQTMSAILALIYFVRKFQTVEIFKKHFKLQAVIVKRISALGITPFISQLSMMIVLVALNYSLTTYGAQSQYGPDIPLAVAGIAGKCEFIFMAISLGFVAGAQPIIGFNYGAKQYHRVLQTLYLVMICVGFIGFCAFASFQLFPRQIISIFGSGDASYYAFAQKYLRIFLFFVFINGFQPVSGNYFSCIGKPIYGVIITLSRRIVLLIPILLILPRYFGMNGVLYAGPIADFGAACLIFFFLVKGIRELKVSQI